MSYLYILITQSRLSKALATSFKHLEMHTYHVTCMYATPTFTTETICLGYPLLPYYVSMPFPYATKALKAWIIRIIIGEQRPELKHAVKLIV